jgi:hypothetical protein
MLPNLTLCRWATYKDVFAIPCIVDGSHIISVFLHNIVHMRLSDGLAHLSPQDTESLMQDVWVSSSKQIDWS